jgi:sulfate-transporting ATPase
MGCVNVCALNFVPRLDAPPGIAILAENFDDSSAETQVASYQYIYVMKGLNKAYPGAKPILNDVHLQFMPGAKIGVLGPNGAGKSTLMRIMGGIDPEFSGEAWAAEGARVGYLEQEPHLDPTKDVLGNVMDGVGEIQSLIDEFNDVTGKLGEVTDDDELAQLYERMGDLQEQIDAVDGWNLDRTLDIAMDALRCPPGDVEVTTLSGGERRRVALCRLLLEKPDLLLLDEPTNHLDAESVAWLENYLKEYAGTVLMVTHDRYFLDNVTGWILEIDRGRAIPYEGNYSQWLVNKQKRMAQEGREEVARQRTLSHELDWINQSPRARQAKSKARIRSYEELHAKSSSMKITKAQIVMPAGERLGDLVIEATNISKGYDGRLLIDDLSFKIPPGAIVGIVGPNGVGKTTLFRMITGQEEPDSGTIRVGPTVDLGYVDQSRDSLDANKNVWEEISGGLDILTMGKSDIQSRAYVGAFNFKGGDQQKKVGQLSGGERNRVHLAKMLKEGHNVLLLDEPTNDLDVDTLRALEDAVDNFAGCAVIISHDRWFLDRIATHILAYEGDSKAVFFEGNYEDYEADRHRRMGTDADQPHRVNFKKFAV